MLTNNVSETDNLRYLNEEKKFSTDCFMKERAQDLSYTSSQISDVDLKQKLNQMHAVLFEQAHVSMSLGFSTITKNLIELEKQFHEKLDNMYQEQTKILESTRPGQNSMFDILENIKKIDRSLNRFEENAGNLSHIKLTLTRAALLVTPDGNLAKLVTVQSNAQQITNGRAGSFFQNPLGPLSQQLRTIAETSFESQEQYQGQAQGQAQAQGQEQYQGRGRQYQAQEHWSHNNSEPYERTFADRELERPFVHRDLERPFVHRELERSLTCTRELERPLTCTREFETRFWNTEKLEIESSLRNPGSFLNLDRCQSSQFSNNPGVQDPRPNFTQSKQGCTCFVFHLPQSVNNETLHRLFKPFGTILNTYVPVDKITNRTRGFGFVDFSNTEEARAAVKNLDRYPLENKILSVSIKI